MASTVSCFGVWGVTAQDDERLLYWESPAKGLDLPLHDPEKVPYLWGLVSSSEKHAG